jgi:hypothetical protein
MQTDTRELAKMAVLALVLSLTLILLIDALA